MEILNKEKEWALLKEQIELHTNSVFDYGKQLAVVYPESTYVLFNTLITTQAKEASTRPL